MTRRAIGTAVAAILCGFLAAQAPRTPRNVILFVPDGLRALRVDDSTAPTMAALAREGVSFANSHAMFPTLTVPNGSALATGHYPGDTGLFGNLVWTGFPVTAATNDPAPNTENDAVMAELDRHFGDFVHEPTILSAARAANLSTAAIGKLGPTLLQDHTANAGTTTLIVDDATGSRSGVPLPPDLAKAMVNAGLPATAPPRGDVAKGGSLAEPATALNAQASWFLNVATKVVLPLFKERGKPFLMVYWARDPDGTQHNNLDAPGAFEPGINGPSSLRAIRNADTSLRTIRESLKALGLDAATNIVIAADHGFSTVSKESQTSPSAKRSYHGVPAGKLPPGFFALDLGHALDLPVRDAGAPSAALEAGDLPTGSALLGSNPAAPDVLVVPNGGSDLIYVLNTNKRPLVERIIAALFAQDYVSGVFVDDALGTIPGTLPLSAINLSGNAVLPRPSLVVGFRSFSTGCQVPAVCGVIVVDGTQQQGQGQHGSFSRADTFNFMAAVGPSFKRGYVDRMPTSNADVGRTIASILGLKIADKGKLVGRVMAEALLNGQERPFTSKTMTSMPAANGLRTVLQYQEVGPTRYFDAGGFPGRTLGLAP